MENKINSFEELEAWKSARELVRFVYRIFRRAPANRDFGLRGQVQELIIQTGKLVSGLMRSTSSRIAKP